MYRGDKGRPNAYRTLRYNYDVLIDKEKVTLQKLSKELGFYNVVFMGKSKEEETVFDTDKNLFTGAGLILRRRNTKTRTYFSLVRLSEVATGVNREKKSFLGECDPHDNPAEFPEQVADGINKIFNNLFTINLVDVVKHCMPYIKIKIFSNEYKIISGTGYEAIIGFETLKVKNVRNGKTARLRNFSLAMLEDPAYEKERNHILDVIDHKCKELAPLNRNRFEIAEIAVRTREKTQPKSKEELKKQKENRVDEEA